MARHDENNTIVDGKTGGHLINALTDQRKTNPKPKVKKTKM